MYTIGIVACIGWESIINAIMADRETKAVEFRTYRHVKDTSVVNYPAQAVVWVGPVRQGQSEKAVSC